MTYECTGIIKNILLDSPELQVFNVITEDKNVRVKMSNGDFCVGENITVSGHTEYDEQHGLQLIATSADRVRVTNSLLKEFICQGIGIGIATANRLLEAYPDTLADLLDAKEYRAICAVERVSQSSAIVIINNWHSQSGKAGLSRFMDDVLTGASPKLRADIRRSALNAFAIYGEETIEKLKDDPYRIWAFSSFKNAEKFASVLNVPKDDNRRLICAAQEVLHIELKRGSTVVPKDEFLIGLSKLLGKSIFIDAYNLVCALKDTLPLRILVQTCPFSSNETFALKGIAQMEAYVEQQLKLRMESFVTPISVTDEMIANYQMPDGHLLSQEQCRAVRAILNNPVTAISGGGGTGKTSVLYAVNELIKEAGLGVVQVALAGKASQRLIQQTKDHAYTITSLLAKIKKEPKFLDSLECPVFHIDEASMVDIHTMYKVLVAFEGKPIRLNMVGDWAQLSPIGPGIIFHKLIHSKKLATVELTQNFRSTKGVSEAAQCIKDGRVFTPNKEVEIIEYSDDSQLLSIVEDTYEKYAEQDLHVVAAKKDTVAEINIRLHKMLRKKDRVIDFAPEFRINDNVIYKRNNNVLGLVNGSTGTIKCGTSVVIRGKKAWPVDLVVDFKLEGEVGLTLSDIKNTNHGEYHLQHAYAITCHSAQGSEFDVVIVVAENTPLVERSWLYTAITRAKKKVILIAKPNQIDKALSRGFSFENRFSRLYVD